MKYTIGEWMNMCKEVGNENDMMNNERVFDSSIELKDNAMLKHRMELFDQWDFEKNDELGLDIYKVTFGSKKIAWWNCPDCESPYDMPIQSRAGKQNQNCPYCRGYRVNDTNSLASLNPTLAKEWHPTLNGDLTANDVPRSYGKKVWWLGAKCGHPWDTTIGNRVGVNKTNCPVCNNKEVLVGFNDMWTTNSSQAEMLLNSENGYKYTQSSNVKVDWKCLECENIVKNKPINRINYSGLYCPKCSDGIPFGEKIVYNLLKESSVEFEFDISQRWSQGKRYDFYLPYYNWIVEVHGKQHYEEDFSGHEGARTSDEEQENDRLKEILAKENGIDKYIVIDARESTVEWMKNSILNSDIMEIARDIDFIKIGQLASNSFVKEACDLWNSGIKSTPRIAEILKISRSTVRIYLKKGAEIGWCDYCPEESTRLGRVTAGKLNTKSVVQLDKNSNFIKLWKSAAEVERQIKIRAVGITSVCRGGNRVTCSGFRWMYEEDYKKYLSGDIELTPLIIKNAISIVQLDTDSNLIEVFNSQSEAALKLGISGSGAISGVCRGRYKTAYGFKWMFKEDYDEFINQKEVS